jgi:hypothetical protein
MERNCSDILAQAAYVKYLKNGYVEQEKNVITIRSYFVVSLIPNND